MGNPVKKRQPPPLLNHQAGNGQTDNVGWGEANVGEPPPLCKTLTEPKDAIEAAKTKVYQSIDLRDKGQINEALRLATEGLETLLQLGADNKVLAWATRQRGLTYQAKGDLESALVDGREALASFEKANDDYRVACCHHDIGLALVSRGSLGSGEYHYEKAKQLWQRLGHLQGLARTLNGLGTALYMTGKYAEALAQFQANVNLAEQIKADEVAAVAQAGLGDVYFALADYTQALEAYHYSAELAEKVGLPLLVIYNQIKMGECFYQKDDLNQALDLASRAREIATELGLYFERGLASFLLAKIYVAWEYYETSFDLFEEALSWFVKNSLLEQIKVKLWWAYSLLLDLRTTAALKKLQEAIQLILETGVFSSGLGPTLQEVCPLLLHFFHWGRTSAGVQRSIFSLLEENLKGSYDLTAGMQFFAFGPPTIVINGKPKQFTQRGRTTKMPEILAFLLLKSERGGCRWSQVCAAIWPDLPADSVSALFHQHLRRLRDTYKGLRHYVVLKNDYYILTRDHYTWCDILVFERLYERILTLPSAEALSLQLELIDLYQGDFLAGFDLKEWGINHQNNYEMIFMRTVRQASGTLVEQGLYWKALAVLEKGINQDYLCEELHCTILKIYAKQGLSLDMHEHYTQVCEIFKREMNNPPSQVQQLYHQLQKQIK
jgi:tetratricopeptide (TPR) repeat protein